MKSNEVKLILKIGAIFIVPIIIYKIIQYYKSKELVDNLEKIYDQLQDIQMLLDNNDYKSAKDKIKAFKAFTKSRYIELLLSEIGDQNGARFIYQDLQLLNGEGSSEISEIDITKARILKFKISYIKKSFLQICKKLDKKFTGELQSELDYKSYKDPSKVLIKQQSQVKNLDTLYHNLQNLTLTNSLAEKTLFVENYLSASELLDKLDVSLNSNIKNIEICSAIKQFNENYYSNSAIMTFLNDKECEAFIPLVTEFQKDFARLLGQIKNF